MYPLRHPETSNCRMAHFLQLESITLLVYWLKKVQLCGLATVLWECKQYCARTLLIKGLFGLAY